MSLQVKNGLTKRAPDVWDSAAFSSIFLASSFSCSQTESTPTHTQVTQTVGLLSEEIMKSQDNQRPPLATQEEFFPGKAFLLTAQSPRNNFGAAFEDDGETGYFYAMDLSLQEQ
ncbi:MAG: DUF2251 domain-containing protein, partial [bacterium]|nr:DUF2251 domain-containing protein [bacterium]